MRKSLLALAVATALATLAGAAMPNKAQAQVFVFEGARYCFYFDGWHGAGWYRCGFRWRKGLGWGGVYGWHGWRHQAWERRRGHRDGVTIQGNINRGGVTVRERSTTRTMRGNTQIRGGGSATIQGRTPGGGEVRGTTGAGRSGPGATIRGGAKMNAAPGGGATIQGGGGANIQGGVEKRP